MKPLKIFTILFACFISVALHADPQTVKILSEGAGPTEERAIIHASIDAVKHAVGMYMISDQIMKNRKLIKDKILTYSNGFVKNFKVISKEEDEDGVFYVEIVAYVEVGKLQEKINSLNIATKKVGSTQQKVQVTTKHEKSRGFTETSKSMFLDPLLPTGNSHEVKIIGSSVVDDNSEIMRAIEGHYINKSVHESSELNNLLPYQIDFTVTLVSSYLRNLYRFLEKSSLKQSRVYKRERGKEYKVFMYEYKDGIEKLKVNFSLNRTDFNRMSQLCKDVPYLIFIGIDFLDVDNNIIKSAFYKVRGGDMIDTESSDVPMQPLFAYTERTKDNIKLLEYTTSSTKFFGMNAIYASASSVDLARGISCKFSDNGLKGIGVFKNSTTISSVVYLSAEEINKIETIRIKVE